MQQINKKGLKQINGGGVWLGIGIVSGIIFLIGVIDGYTRPLSCR